ncbi:MAG: class II glutamine amidotransferase [Firmicutes bacterium]|nr:class II glutamine amidotransferase [Candidatus Colivicinus equi]
MFVNNPDGAGYMYYDKTHKCVVIQKGFMYYEDLISSLKSKKLDDVNVILHFRIGTSGLMDDLNCHPYPVYQKNARRCKTDLGVAHNGILHDYTPTKSSLINDTQVFIQKVLSNLKKGFQYDTDKLLLINELIGTNKLAFLDDKNKVTIIGNFIQDGDYFYSNTSYKSRVYYTHNSVSKPKKSVSKAKDSTSKMWYKTHESVQKVESIFKDDDEETNDFWKWYDSKYLY